MTSQGGRKDLCLNNTQHWGDNPETELWTRLIGYQAFLSLIFPTRACAQLLAECCIACHKWPNYSSACMHACILVND